MRTASLHSIPEQEVKSPQGRYHLHRRHVSVALGGQRDIGTWGGGHPFDLEWARIPPGAINYPHHAHAAQWELFAFLAGQGEIRGPEETISVTAGDHVIFPPGEAHQIRNTGDTDLIYYIIADHPPAELIHYPDTGKWAAKSTISSKGASGPRVFEMKEASYYEPGD
jgi:uncharacterized cupin superfamily protein